MTQPTPARKLRKREVVLAVSAGALAAAGAALILDADDESTSASAVVAGGPIALGAPFEEVSSVGPQTIVITIGDAHSVRSEGPPEALGQLEAVVEDGRLTIQPKSGRFGRGFSRSRLASATFFVTMPRLQAATLAGSGDMRVDRIEGETFSGSIAGSGDMSIGALAVDQADFSIAGSGDLVAAGRARSSRISIAGSGDVRAGALTSASANISVLGSGDVALKVDGPASVSIMGRGDVEIDGNAQCTVSRIGRGEVRCGGEIVAD
jgi:hypothetical protein